MSYFRQEYDLSHTNQGLSEEDFKFLLNHLAVGTSTGYGYTFKKFRTFCETFNADPLSCPPAIVVKYLHKLFEEGAQYRTVNYHMSTISKFHCSIAGIPIGKHPLVKQAVKAVFGMRPPLPRYSGTFDICPVLHYIADMPPLNELTLKELTHKAVFLTCFSNLTRWIIYLSEY